MQRGSFEAHPQLKGASRFGIRADLAAYRKIRDCIYREACLPPMLDRRDRRRLHGCRAHRHRWLFAVERGDSEALIVSHYATGTTACSGIVVRARQSSTNAA